MRYAEWRYTRRVQVDRLRVVRSATYTCKPWVRAILTSGPANTIRSSTVRGSSSMCAKPRRHIDSWLLSDLLRKAWFYWQRAVGNPSWNMQYAFRGHIVGFATRKPPRTASLQRRLQASAHGATVIGTAYVGRGDLAIGGNIQADTAWPRPAKPACTGRTACG